MSAHRRAVIRLKKWYHERVRSFLERMGSERLDEFDRDLARLEKRADGLCKPLAACFVGGSGVGKSTLINSLVGREKVIVPSGGVGPLTAQALTIEYGDQPFLQAIYHAPHTLWKLIFALESIFARELGHQADGEGNDLKDGLDSDVLFDVEELQKTDDVEKRRKAEQYVKQAQLLIKGQQEGVPDKPYIIDGLRESIGKERKWGTILRAEDSDRLARLKQVFESKEIRAESLFEKDGSDDAFDVEIRNHASGFLAPAIKSLTVAWNSELLAKGLQIVDLPGVGIAGDVHRAVTDSWMRGDANIVVLVVDHRGVREADADLLRSSGFLTRLLHSADDASADPVSLLIAVVKADEIAEERRARDKSKSKREHLVDVMQRCRDVVRSQIRDRLEEAWSLAGSELSETKRIIVDRLVAHLSIFPLSSIQYRKLVCEDDEDRAFILSEDESGIPQLSEGLANLAENHRQDCFVRFRESVCLCQDRMNASLELIKARWEEGARAKEEAEELQKQLAEFLKPLSKQFHARQGQYRSFLKDTIPAQIETLLANARQSSLKSIRAYLRTLQNAHWSTLRAAVRRGGTYVGARHIDLPRDFSQTFEEPIAEAWSQTILKQVRQRTKEFADDCISFVQQVVDWAREQGGRVQPKLIEAQQEAIQTDAKQLTSVGREMVNELRDRVKQDLVTAIEVPIRRKCQAFVNRNADIGAGVKHRILELFDELADDAVESAIAPAQKVLVDNYRAVESEIREVFKTHQNPLESAESAIVSSHADYVKRSDAQKRARVLEEIDLILKERPTLFDIEAHEAVEV